MYDKRKCDSAVVSCNLSTCTSFLDNPAPGERSMYVHARAPLGKRALPCSISKRRLGLQYVDISCSFYLFSLALKGDTCYDQPRPTDAEDETA